MDSAPSLHLLVERSALAMNHPCVSYRSTGVSVRKTPRCISIISVLFCYLSILKTVNRKVNLYKMAGNFLKALCLAGFTYIRISET